MPKRFIHFNRDHPRACGEQDWKFYTPTDAEGSSPRVRGAGKQGYRHEVPSGIIPARAGSSPARAGSGMAAWDHPRACGEQLPQMEQVINPQGSSPRVRGAGGQVHAARDRGGIIPARAGSSTPRCRAPRRGRDHPRACGEQSTRFTAWRRRMGSSPRVRGAEIKF